MKNLTQSTNNVDDICFFTICSKNFMAYARTLYFSLKEQYPNLTFYTALCDEKEGLDDQPFEVIELSSLNIKNIIEMSNKYNITEFNTSIKPSVFNYLFSEKKHQYVVYLDPDILVVDKLTELELAFKNGANGILTPHVLEPAENVEVHDQKMLVFGAYNLGFAAFKNTAEVCRIMSWWERRLENQCIIDLPEGLFVDQKWADLLPSFISDLHILRHPGYNVAYWNLSQRTVALQGSKWTVNESPLRFVHFSGNKLDDVNVFSRHSTEITMEKVGDLTILLNKYRDLVYSNDHVEYSKLEYKFNWNGDSGINLHTPEPQTPKTSRTNSKSRSSSSKKAFPIANLAYKRDILSWKETFKSAVILSGGRKNLLKKIVRRVKSDGLTDSIERVFTAKGVPLKPKQVQSPATNIIKEKLTGDVVFIDWSTPRPDKDAGSITAFYLLKILVEIGFKVTFIPSDLQKLGEYTTDIENLGVNCLHREDIGSVESFLESFGKNYQYFFLCRAPIAALYIDKIREFSPDSKIILNTSDLHYLREQRQAELSGKMSDQKMIDYIQHIKQEELQTIQKSNTTIVMSNSEQEILKVELPESDIRLVPLMYIDVHPTLTSYHERSDILFIGGFPHQPNIDAVLYFCEEIWPIIHKKLPDIHFVVIGNAPPEEILALNNTNGIKVLGFVQDLEPHFSKIKLSVAPLRYGAGIKGKLGTSLGYGVPAVASTIAVEGMPLQNNSNILIADEAKEFANKVIQLYTSEDLWEKISLNGKKVIEEQYSVNKGKERILELFNTSSSYNVHNNFHEFNSYQAFMEYLDSSKKSHIRHRKFELDSTKYDTPSFKLPGKCAVCEKPAVFNVSFMYSCAKTDSGLEIPNWREHLDCQHCGFVNRIRAAIHYMKQEMTLPRSANIYLTEQVTPLFTFLKSQYPNLVGSEYLGDSYPYGEESNGIRNEDLMNLTFNHESFDCILSFDVLEHVPFPEDAFKQIYRCLKPGGKLLFAAPFSSDSKTMIKRASMDSTGNITHHLPPEYHGNPVDHENGALCYQYFAWDVLDDLSKVGFKECHALTYWSNEFLYLGERQFLFTAIKP